jgi:hypothetical protein
MMSMAIHTTEHGSGGIHLGTDVVISCSFVLEQHGDGALYVRFTCNDPLAGFHFLTRQVTRVAGVTEEGLSVLTGGPHHLRELDGKNGTLMVAYVQVGLAQVPAAEHTFTLTNLIFPSSSKSPEGVALTPDDIDVILLRPLPDYDQRLDAGESSRHAMATATASITSTIGIEDLRLRMTDLCYALSIAQGHKVNWITHTASNKGVIVWRYLQNSVTRDWSSLPLDFQAGNDRRLPLVAAEAAYPYVRQRREEYQWNGPLIDAWLASRTDNDYINGRALKFVVVIETLRAIILRDKPTATIIPASEWERTLDYILPQLEFFLHANLHLDEATTARLVHRGKWKSHNNASFRDEINHTFQLLNIIESPEAIQTFVESRNSLVHRGSFACTKKGTASSEAQTQEFLRIARFVDRVIMQIFGLRAYIKQT